MEFLDTSDQQSIDIPSFVCILFRSEKLKKKPPKLVARIDCVADRKVLRRIL